MKNKRSTPRLSILSALSLGLPLAMLSPTANAQTTYVWDGGPLGTGTALATAENWNPDGVPASTTTNGDTIQWNGTVGGDLFLTYAANFGGPATTGWGLNVDLLPGQTGNVTIDNSDPSNARSFRVRDITVNSVGGLTFGNGTGSTITMTLQTPAGTTRTLTNNSANALTFHSEVTISSPSGQSIVFDGTGDSVVNGVLALNASTVTKNGAGTLTLAGVNTYTGVTTLNAGTLIIGDGATGSIARNVSVSAGTLTGSLVSGNNIGTSTTTIGDGLGTADSIVTAGTEASSTGRLALAGALTLDSDANFVFDLNSTTGVGDEVIVAGTTTINASAQFTFNFLGTGAGLVLGQTFTVIGGAGNISGSAFGNLAEGDTLTFGAYEFTANNYLTAEDLIFTVTAVPEPSTFLLFGIGAAAVLWRARRKVAA